MNWLGVAGIWTGNIGFWTDNRTVIWLGMMMLGLAFLWSVRWD